MTSHHVYGYVEENNGARGHPDLVPKAIIGLGTESTDCHTCTHEVCGSLATAAESGHRIVYSTRSTPVLH